MPWFLLRNCSLQPLKFSSPNITGEGCRSSWESLSTARNTVAAAYKGNQAFVWLFKAKALYAYPLFMFLTGSQFLWVLFQFKAKNVLLRINKTIVVLYLYTYMYIILYVYFSVYSISFRSCLSYQWKWPKIQSSKGGWNQFFDGYWILDAVEYKFEWHYRTGEKSFGQKVGLCVSVTTA